MSKYTKGPWEVTNVSLDSSRRGVYRISHKRTPTLEELPMNANLIATALELLEACKEAREKLSLLSKQGRYADGWEMLEQAIAKAETL